MDIAATLLSHRDEAYRDFTARLIPNLDPACFIGVRTPVLRRLAKEIAAAGERDAFLDALPHRYYEENQLHGFLLFTIKDFGEAMRRLEAFLPYIDNWSTSDTTRIRVPKDGYGVLLDASKRFIADGRTYFVRYGVDMLMTYFLDDRFDPSLPALVASVSSDDYYVNMMRAWYFATGLAKRRDDFLPYLTENRLDTWTHNKTIRKAIESFRIPDGEKEFLRTLTRK